MANSRARFNELRQQGTYPNDLAPECNFSGVVWNAVLRYHGFEFKGCNKVKTVAIDEALLELFNKTLDNVSEVKEKAPPLVEVVPLKEYVPLQIPRVVPKNVFTGLNISFADSVLNLGGSYSVTHSKRNDGLRNVRIEIRIPFKSSSLFTMFSKDIYAKDIETFITSSLKQAMQNYNAELRI